MGQEKLQQSARTLWCSYEQFTAPSKIPGGALEFDVSGLREVDRYKLNLDTAICELTERVEPF